MTNEGTRKIPPTPVLDSSQRRAGYDRSLRLRRARAVVKASLMAGDILLVEALELEETQQMKVRQLLLALPGVGQRKSEKLLAAAGINPARSVARMGPLQRLSLLKQVTAWQIDRSA